MAIDVPGLPRAPRGLSVEVVELEAGQRALAVASRAIGRRLAFGGMFASSVAGAVAGDAAIWGVAMSGLNLWMIGRRPAPLLIVDDAVIVRKRRVTMLAGTEVSASLMFVWLRDGGGTREVVFTGGPRHVRWVARLLREVIRLGHLPASLTLPPARARLLPEAR